MIYLRKALQKKLKEYHSSVYYEQSPEDALFPYVVFTFPNSFTNEYQEVFVMDVDIWDNKEDTTDIERLSSEYWKGLNRYCYIDGNIQFTVYRSNRLFDLEDDNPTIKRRKLIFEVKYFERE